MKTFKRIVRSNVFETNSSSSHCFVYDITMDSESKVSKNSYRYTDPLVVIIPPEILDEFGAYGDATMYNEWDIKAMYVYMHLVHYDDESAIQTLKDTIAKYFNVKEVIFHYDDDYFINHQSQDMLEYTEITEEYLTSLLFSKNIFICLASDGDEIAYRDQIYLLNHFKFVRL